MNVLVIGASGFIGTHLCTLLQREGIVALRFDRWHGPQTTILGDVRDATAVSEVVARCDGVIHLAGVLGTAETIDNPLPAVETNILGSLNVFQACRRYDKPAVYITVGNWWFLNSYSITKTTAENLAWQFNNEYGTRIAVVRALNAYGPGQKASPVRKIIPTFVLAALRGEAITIYGDGTQVMDMIYVEDVCKVLLRALTVDHDQYRRPSLLSPAPKFDAGTGERTTVNDIAAAVLDEIGLGSLRYEPMRAGEPEHSTVLGDPTTLAPLFNGTPSFVSLKDGLRETVEWYRRSLRS